MGVSEGRVTRAAQMIAAGCSRERLRRVTVFRAPGGETRIEFDAEITAETLTRLRGLGWEITTLAAMKKRHGGKTDG